MSYVYWLVYPEHAKISLFDIPQSKQGLKEICSGSLKHEFSMCMFLVHQLLKMLLMKCVLSTGGHRDQKSGHQAIPEEKNRVD